MAVIPVFRTWTAGEVVTAAYFNSNLRDAGNFFLSWPVLEMRQTVAQSLASTFTPLTFDTEDIDTDNWHSVASNTDRITPQTAGRVQFSGGGGINASATGRRVLAWFLNGSETLGSRFEPCAPAAGNNWVGVARTKTIFCNGSTDIVQLQLFQNTGGALNSTVATTGEQPNVTARLIGTT